MQKITLRVVVEIGLRLAAVGLLIVAVGLTGTLVFAVLVFGVSDFPIGLIKGILVAVVAPVAGAIVLWKAATHVSRGGQQASVQ